MIKLNLQFFGGRGASANTSNNISSLQAFKENARQFNQALIQAKNDKVAELQYTDMTGRVVKRYLNGGVFTDRKPSVQQNDMSGKKINGVLKVNFREPISWKFPGEVERVEKLESSVNSVRGIKAMGNLAMSLKRQDSHITTMINQVESGQEEGDINTLLTLRRRVRQAQAKLKNKRGM